MLNVVLPMRHDVVATADCAMCADDRGLRRYRPVVVDRRLRGATNVTAEWPPNTPRLVATPLRTPDYL